MGEPQLAESSRTTPVPAGPAGVSGGGDAERSPARLTTGLFKVLRPHQWVKNFLLFLPLLLAHEVGLADPVRRGKLVAGLLAFVAFSLCASAGYVLNDLHDLESDRQHSTKRRRPFASGVVPVSYGPPLLVALIVASGGIAFSLPARFGALLGVYFAVTLAYSFYLKRKLLLDVVTLAGLYTLRIVAGAVAVAVPLTPWLLAFSMFFFLSLAFVKRYTEVMALDAAGKMSAVGRSYRVEDLSILPAAGLASAYMSVLVFALYINEAIHGGKLMDATASAMPPRVLYTRPYMLWLICPVLLYWVTRLWFLARRGGVHEDPIVFAIEDRVSWAAGVVAVILVALASLPRGVAWLP